MSPALIIKVANADAVVGYDCMKESEATAFATSNTPRRVTAVGMVGSTNPGDCAITIRYGQKIIARILNSRGGANLSPVRDDMQYVGSADVLGVNEPLQVIVETAAAAQDIVIALHIKDVVARVTGGFRRGFGRRRRGNYTIQNIGGQRMVVYSDGRPMRPARY